MGKYGQLCCLIESQSQDTPMFHVMTSGAVKLLRDCGASPDLRLLIILTGKLGVPTQIRYSPPDKKVELRVAARLTGHCHRGVNVNVMYNEESMCQESWLHRQFKDRRHMPNAIPYATCPYHLPLPLPLCNRER